MATDSILVMLPGEILYPEECRIQTFTYNDASTLSILPKTQDTQKLFEVIDRRISLDVKMLTLQDFWFILYWQRINSYSSFPVKLPWTCPHCGTKNVDELTGSKLVIEDLDPEYYHGMEIQFPDSGRLHFRLKLVGDEILVKKFLREQKITDSSPELFDEMLTACMLEHSGGSLEERLHIVKNMSAEDQFVLKALESEFDYGVKSYANFTCEECKEVVKVSYQFDLSSFFPSVQDKSNVRSRILLRKAFKSNDRVSPGDGFHEDDLHQGNSYSELKGTQGQTEPNISTESSKEKTITLTPSSGNEPLIYSLTPDELKKLIQQGIKEIQTESIMIPYGESE